MNILLIFQIVIVAWLVVFISSLLTIVYLCIRDRAESKKEKEVKNEQD